jgi:hypothetical protein
MFSSAPTVTPPPWLHGGLLFCTPHDVAVASAVNTQWSTAARWHLKKNSTGEAPSDTLPPSETKCLGTFEKHAIVHWRELQPWWHKRIDAMHIEVHESDSALPIALPSSLRILSIRQTAEHVSSAYINTLVRMIACSLPNLTDLALALKMPSTRNKEITAVSFAPLQQMKQLRRLNLFEVQLHALSINTPLQELRNMRQVTALLPPRTIPIEQLLQAGHHLQLREALWTCAPVVDQKTVNLYAQIPSLACIHLDLKPSNEPRHDTYKAVSTGIPKNVSITPSDIDLRPFQHLPTLMELRIINRQIAAGHATTVPESAWAGTLGSCIQLRRLVLSAYCSRSALQISSRTLEAAFSRMHLLHTLRIRGLDLADDHRTLRFLIPLRSSLQHLSLEHFNPRIPRQEHSYLLELKHLRTLLLTRVFESATHTSTDPLAPNHIAQIIPTLRHFLHHD